MKLSYEELDCEWMFSQMIKLYTMMYKHFSLALQECWHDWQCVKVFFFPGQQTVPCVKTTEWLIVEKQNKDHNTI